MLSRFVKAALTGYKFPLHSINDLIKAMLDGRFFLSVLLFYKPNLVSVGIRWGKLVHKSLLVLTEILYSRTALPDFHIGASSTSWLQGRIPDSFTKKSNCTVNAECHSVQMITDIIWCPGWLSFLLKNVKSIELDEFRKTKTWFECVAGLFC